MKIYVDADACPVQEEIFVVAKTFSKQVILIKSYSHFSHDPLPDYVETIYVDKGKDVADFAIVERVAKKDLVVTHDYGLAAICLGKGCAVIHPKGFLYTNKNIERLLQTRHEHALMRRAGQRTKGPSAFTEHDKISFKQSLIKIIEKTLNSKKK